MGQPFISQISLWGLSFAVEGWAFCDGQVIAISQNTALFSLLADRYGGDGRSTFGFPNLKGRMAFGPGYSGEKCGAVGGVETVTLNDATMPQHSHPGTILTVANASGTGGPSSNVVMAKPAVTTSGGTATGSSFSDSSGVNALISTGVDNTESIGGNLPFSVRSPYLSVTYEIALEGYYPARD
ncbi:phage tail protein [Flexibacterium corallicola]|uniref:phage tail protein n=1 Tax=Flexibacterium corallicola TaxID=3037259 RepID=UPI00286F63B4|nr:tail fiber protein [Pseudovibrio sp. M1P-2-3]